VRCLLPCGDGQYAPEVLAKVEKSMGEIRPINPSDPTDPTDPTDQSDRSD
jgi:hypothetical protein